MKAKILTYLKFLTILGMIIFLYGFANDRNSTKKIKDVEVVFSKGENPFVTNKTIENIIKRNGIDI